MVTRNKREPYRCTMIANLERCFLNGVKMAYFQSKQDSPHAPSIY
uniref:Uncharacterized protein n=1 Tax=Populus trichocarpa TaxID=3694 RepID=A0A3N7FUY2_POPTR